MPSHERIKDYFSHPHYLLGLHVRRGQWWHRFVTPNYDVMDLPAEPTMAELSQFFKKQLMQWLESLISLNLAIDGFQKSRLDPSMVNCNFILRFLLKLAVETHQLVVWATAFDMLGGRHPLRELVNSEPSGNPLRDLMGVFGKMIRDCQNEEQELTKIVFWILTLAVPSYTAAPSRCRMPRSPSSSTASPNQNQNPSPDKRHPLGSELRFRLRLRPKQNDFVPGGRDQKDGVRRRPENIAPEFQIRPKNRVSHARQPNLEVSQQQQPSELLSNLWKFGVIYYSNLLRLRRHYKRPGWYSNSNFPNSSKVGPRSDQPGRCYFSHRCVHHPTGIQKNTTQFVWECGCGYWAHFECVSSLHLPGIPPGDGSQIARERFPGIFCGKCQSHLETVCEPQTSTYLEMQFHPLRLHRGNFFAFYLHTFSGSYDVYVNVQEKPSLYSVCASNRERASYRSLEEKKETKKKEEKKLLDLWRVTGGSLENFSLPPTHHPKHSFFLHQNPIEESTSVTKIREKKNDDSPQGICDPSPLGIPKSSPSEMMKVNSLCKFPKSSPSEMMKVNSLCKFPKSSPSEMMNIKKKNEVIHPPTMTTKKENGQGKMVDQHVSVEQVAEFWAFDELLRALETAAQNIAEKSLEVKDKSSEVTNDKSMILETLLIRLREERQKLALSAGIPRGDESQIAPRFSGITSSRGDESQISPRFSGIARGDGSQIAHERFSGISISSTTGSPPFLPSSPPPPQPPQLLFSKLFVGWSSPEDGNLGWTDSKILHSVSYKSK